MKHAGSSVSKEEPSSSILRRKIMEHKARIKFNVVPPFNAAPDLDDLSKRVLSPSILILVELG